MENDESNKLFSLDELKRISNGDKKFIVEMIEIFIKTTEEGMNEIEHALKQENYKVIGNYAHKIAPPCRHMGADALLDTFKKIESAVRDSVKISELEPLVLIAREQMDNIMRELKIESIKLSE